MYLECINEDVWDAPAARRLAGNQSDRRRAYESHLQLPRLTVFERAIPFRAIPTQGTDPEWLRPDTRPTRDADWPVCALLASGRTQRARAGPQPPNERPPHKTA